jgi:hypothetical protein
MKVLLIAVFSLLLPLAGHADDLYRDKQVWIYDSTTEEATVQLAGRAGKAIYDSLATPEQPHRGLFIRGSVDHKVNCVRGADRDALKDYSCNIDFKR